MLWISVFDQAATSQSDEVNSVHKGDALHGIRSPLLQQASSPGRWPGLSFVPSDSGGRDTQMGNLIP